MSNDQKLNKGGDRENRQNKTVKQGWREKY